MSIDAFAPFARNPASLKFHTHFNNISVGAVTLSGLFRSALTGTDALTGYNCVTDIQAFFDSFAVLEVQYFPEDLTLTTGTLATQLEATTATSTLSSVANAKDLVLDYKYRATTPGSDSKPQVWLTVYRVGAANRSDVEEIYESFIMMFPSDLKSRLVLGGNHYFSFFDYKTDGYLSQGHGDLRFIGQVYKSSTDSNLRLDFRIDNNANGVGVVPSVATSTQTYQFIQFPEADIPLGVPLLFESYIRRPAKINVRSTATEPGALLERYERDLVGGVWKTCWTNLSTGEFSHLANFVGGVQMGAENLPFGRLFRGMYTPGTPAMQFRMTDWQVWDKMPAHSSLRRRYTYYLAKFYAPLRGSLALTKGTGSATFTRATAAWDFNDEGKLIKIPSGAVRMRGYRPVINLFSYSEDFTAAPWVKNNTTFAGGKLSASATTSSHSLQTSLAQSPTIKTVYFEVKADEETIISIGNAAVSAAATFDLAAGSVVSVSSGRTASIVALADGWYRCIFTTTVTDSAFWYLSLRGNLVSYLGDGVSGVFVRNAQCEEVYGRADKTPSEYVSTNVLSSPWHGAGADGVKYFSTHKDGTDIADADYRGVGLNPNQIINTLLYCRDLTNAVYSGGVAGSEFVVNGTPGVDTSGWYTDDSTLSIVSGTLQVTTIINHGRALQELSLTVGKRYIVSFTFTKTGGNAEVGIAVASDGSGGQYDGKINVSSSGTYSFGFIAKNSTRYLNLQVNTATPGDTARFSLISIKEATVQVALTQIGIDNQTNAASLLTATTDNATISQTITAASAAACSGFYVKRSVGSGSIYFTRDGGANWTDITSSINSTDFTLVKIENTSVTNPQVGFKIATSGDAIIVDAGINHLGTKIASCPILTTSASVTVNAETLTYPTTSNIDNLQGSILATFTADSYSSGMGNIVGSSTAGLATSSSYTCQAKDGTNTVNGSVASPSGTIKIGMAWDANLGTMYAIGENGVETSGTYDGSLGLSTIAILPSVDGYIKDVACFNRVLSNSEVQSVFNS